MRLFVALEIPPEIREKISEKFLQQIPQNWFSTVAAEKLHFTLCFIGERTKKEAGEIKRKLAEIKFKEFEACVSGIGNFGGRVLWLGVKGKGNEMEALAKIIAEKIGVKGGKFSPHLTIARNKMAGKEKFWEIAGKLWKISFNEKFIAKSFALFESEPAGAGHAYNMLSEITLCSSSSGS